MLPGMTLPDVPPDEDFLWWTAAITVTALPAGSKPTASNPPLGARSPHNPKKWVPKNLHVLRSVTVDGEKDDADESAGKIQTTTFQIVDETEELPAHQTQSLDRRWRMAVNLFHRRCFTNDPLKVARWRDL